MCNLKQVYGSSGGGGGELSESGTAAITKMDDVLVTSWLF